MNYSTKQRELILDLIKNSSSHITAQDICKCLSEKNLKVSVATVYRTLDKFEKDGIIKKYVIDKRSGACYHVIKCDSSDPHFHLKCLKCGRLIHLDCDFLEKLQNHIFEDHGFKISSGNTVIYGFCSDCLPQNDNV